MTITKLLSDWVFWDINEAIKIWVFVFKKYRYSKSLSIL